ncbi:cation-translocating P-type ATPase [Sorangium sp. So ce118]
MERSGTGSIGHAAGERGRAGDRARRLRAAPGRDLHGRAEVARVRAEVAGLFGDPARVARIERDLAAVPGVLSARASARTGRVLVQVREDAAEAAAAVLDAHVVPGAPPPPSARRAARAMLEGVGALVLAARGARRQEGAAGEVARGGPPAPPPGLWPALAGGQEQAAAGRREGQGARCFAAASRAHAEDASDVSRALGVDPRAGLDAAEAQRRLRAVGPNELAGVATRSPIQILAGQIFTVPTALLLGAAGLSLALGDVFDAGAVLLVVGTNAAVGTYAESRAEELLHAWGDLRVGWARVVRDGREQRLAASELVPGDVLALRAGEPVAADARVVLAARDLAADESTLTGESEPAEKGPAKVDEGAPLADRRSMVYAGTTIASGEGAAVVVATGRRTALGDIQRALSREGERTPPLEQELAWIGRRLAAFALASSSAVVVVGLARRRPLRALARSAVALGVAAIPEGFPAVGTTALALASRRLRGRGIVIRRLAAAETLGAVSVVCADKTGTLTENRMRVAEIFLPGEGALRVVARGKAERAARGDGDGPPRGIALFGEDGREVAPSAAPVHALARIAALNADVELSEVGKVVQGSGTERALVEFALAAGYPVCARRLAARRVSEERRSAERAFMVTVHDHPELGHIELVKGAPEQVVARCDALGEARGEVLRRNEAMASRGLRVLALAWRQNGRPDNDAPLVLAGLVGLRDPARAGVKEALATLSGAGIRALMLTGDQERTARAIGVELGIPEDAVHSRVTPEAKLDIVRALQRRGEIVAMTGDGVNDGPALKASDVGVAMGKRGTDIARAVADVVLAEDDLPSLTEAVCEGRRLHDNVRRAIAYFVATNASEVLAMLAGALAGVAPLTPLQLLWINLLTDVAPALALALEPAEPGVMRRPPRDPRARLFGPRDVRALAADAACMSGASLAAYALGGRDAAGTRAFTALVTAQLLHILACRAGVAGRAPEPSPRADNPHVARALAATSALQALALGSPALRRLLGAQRLRAGELALAVAAGALPSLLRGPAGLSAGAGREIAIVNPVNAARADQAAGRAREGDTI